MKKIMSIFLLSALLISVITGCAKVSEQEPRIEENMNNNHEETEVSAEDEIVSGAQEELISEDEDYVEVGEMI